jgi:glutathione peroxidase
MLEKTDVNGAKRHPLYGLLVGPKSSTAGDIRWNFTKFLVGRDGQIIKRFEPDAEPDSPAVTKAVEAALAAK